MFKSILVSASLLLTMHVHAQKFSITGVVQDSVTNHTLPGASIQVQGGSQYAIADAFGNFKLSGLSAGDYMLLIRFLGYRKKILSISVIDNVRVTIPLTESAQLTDEVIVYATRANEKTPTSFTNVSQEALQKQNFGQDMPMLLNWTPSLVTTSDAGAGVGYTGLRIRGSDATRINVTINGIPYNDSESQGTFWVNIPDIASSTQSVQVQRGVGTSTNGAGSFGGSVNVQTLSQQVEPYAEFTLGGGSFNTQRLTAKAGTGLLNDRWTFDARVSKITSDGYIDRASSDLDSYYLSGGYYHKNTILKFITFGGHEKTYQSWNGVDAETMKTDRTFNSAGALYDDAWSVIDYYDNEVDDYRQNHYQLHFTQKISDHWNANLSLHYTKGSGFFEQYKQQRDFADYGLESIVLGDSTLTSSDFIIRKWLYNDFYGTTFSFNYETERTSLILGGGYNEYAKAKHFGEIIWAQYASNANIRDRFYEGESQKNDFNIYGKWNFQVTQAFNIFLDMQLRNVVYKTAGTDDNLSIYNFNDEFLFYNPKAGLSYSLSDNNTLYASYAVAHREPNRTDYLDNDEKPKAEKLKNVEVGWRKSSTKYSIEVNCYLMNYKNQLVLTGNINDVGNPIRANVGKSFRTGLELSGSLSLTEKITWNANLTSSINQNKDYVIDENTTRNTAIILSPAWIGGSQLTWRPFHNAQLSWMSKYVSKQYLDNTEAERLTLDDYLVNDIMFNYGIPLKAIKGCALSLLVNNIFATEYSSNAYSYDGVPYYYPQAGRNFMVMLTAKF